MIIRCQNIVNPLYLKQEIDIYSVLDSLKNISNVLLMHSLYLYLEVTLLEKALHFIFKLHHWGSGLYVNPSIYRSTI